MMPPARAARIMGGCRSRHVTERRATVSEQELREMGPIDYIILEWPTEPSGDEVVPLMLDLVDRGIIRILDIAFVSKDDGGGLTAIEIDDLGPDAAAFHAFRGAA